MQPNYTYKVVACRVVDGDTVEATVDVGFHTHVTEQFRLARINAPEMTTAEGKAARDALIARVAGQPLSVTSTKTEKWRRWLGELYAGDENLNDWLVASGHAAVYHGA